MIELEDILLNNIIYVFRKVGHELTIEQVVNEINKSAFPAVNKMRPKRLLVLSHDVKNAIIQSGLFIEQSWRPGIYYLNPYSSLSPDISLR